MRDIPITKVADPELQTILEGTVATRVGSANDLSEVMETAVGSHGGLLKTPQKEPMVLSIGAFRRIAVLRRVWLPDLDSNQGPAD